MIKTQEFRHALGAVLLAAAPVGVFQAQALVTLKVHHFLPAGSCVIRR